MRGMATLPQGNQELLVVENKVERPRWAWSSARLTAPVVTTTSIIQ